MSIDLRNDGTSALSAAPTFSDRSSSCGSTAAAHGLRLNAECCGGPAPAGDEPTPASEHDRRLDQLRAMPDVRQAKIAKIKEQLQQGSYDPDVVLNKAIERMLDEMD
ncbi:MAG: flagellar biosynthesis anti-sigma factor FlgM [Planctomycetes bacterium]|nr:flagellar biosynthesis anti-sigma factor FlgM [Planctomycetota bacterium]